MCKLKHQGSIPEPELTKVRCGSACLESQKWGDSGFLGLTGQLRLALRELADQSETLFQPKKLVYGSQVTAPKIHYACINVQEHMHACTHIRLSIFNTQQLSFMVLAQIQTLVVQA